MISGPQDCRRRKNRKWEYGLLTFWRDLVIRLLSIRRLRGLLYLSSGALGTWKRSNFLKAF